MPRCPRTSTRSSTRRRSRALPRCCTTVGASPSKAICSSPCSEMHPSPLVFPPRTLDASFVFVFFILFLIIPPSPVPSIPHRSLLCFAPPFFYHLILGVALDLTLSQATLTDSITTYRINYHLYISTSFPPSPISSTYCLPGRMFPFSFSPPQIARFFCLSLSLSLSVHQLCQLVIVRYCAYIADWIGLTGLYPPPHGIRNSTC